MPQLRHILFPFDFSSKGQQVTPFVRALARKCDAHVTVYSVVPPAFEAVPEAMGSQLYTGDTAEQWRRALQSRLDLALVDEFSGPNVQRIADGGNPAIRIVDFARNHGIDLIMMPTHGLGLFRTLLVGSVTSKVLHDAQCPVWTAAHTETQSAPELPRTILCAVDGTSTSCSVMQWAAAFSSTLEAKLRLVHVVGPISDWLYLESERRLQEQVREEARTHLVSAMKTAGIDVPYRVTVGEIVQTVAEEARQERADLVIIGRGSVSEAFGRLRTHAFGIVQHAPCPVISV